MSNVMQQTEAKDGKQPEKSGGEVVFDRVVYTGIGFGVNEASSLWITDQFMYGKNMLEHSSPELRKMGSWFSKEGFERVSEGIAKTFNLTEKIAKDGSKITPKARGGNALLMVTLISGGTLLLLPMKWLEDHKNYWVKKANHMLDSWRSDKLSAAEIEARDKEVEQKIACSPRQSWPSMLLGRTIAVGSSISTGTFVVGPEGNDKLMNWSEKAITGSIQPEGKKDAAHRYARLLSVETYSCAISSIVLEVMSKLFSKRSSQVHDPKTCQKDGAPLAAAVASATESANTDTSEATVERAPRESYAAKVQASKELANNHYHSHA